MERPQQHVFVLLPDLTERLGVEGRPTRLWVDPGTDWVHVITEWEGDPADAPEGFMLVARGGFVDGRPLLAGFDEWSVRARLAALDRVALAIARGADGVLHKIKVSADPVEPNDDDPLEPREFFVDVDGFDGGTSQARTRRYRLELTEVET